MPCPLKETRLLFPLPLDLNPLWNNCLKKQAITTHNCAFLCFVVRHFPNDHIQNRPIMHTSAPSLWGTSVRHIKDLRMAFAIRPFIHVMAPQQPVRVVCSASSFRLLYYILYLSRFVYNNRHLIDGGYISTRFWTRRPSITTNESGRCPYTIFNCIGLDAVYISMRPCSNIAAIILYTLRMYYIYRWPNNLNSLTFV